MESTSHLVSKNLHGQGGPADREEIPRVGLLGIMQELYDDMIPGITETQEAYAGRVADRLQEAGLQIEFPGAARGRADIEAYMEGFEEAELDGVILVMLTYGPALRSVRALRETDLPLMLANIQPEREITKAWDMDDLTYNQGIHGAQDLANTLVRLGANCPVITADWRSGRFGSFVEDWAHAAQARRSLQEMQIAQFGQMPGMGDIAVDEAGFMRGLGPQVDRLSMGLLHRRMEAASEEAVEAIVEADRRRFEVDEALSEEAHRYAARFQVGIESLLEDEGYEGFSIYFDAVGDDGRFEQLHMLAASNLLAKGYGYAAEGDIGCTALVGAGHRLAPDAHFTEMYAMDFEQGSVLQSHMGEGNWRIARSDRSVRLIDRELGIGGLKNPPTVLFQAEPGPGTLASLAPLGAGEYRLVVATGEVLDTEELPEVEMPYFQFRPESGLRDCLDGWLEAGGTHHQCFHLGDQSRQWELWGELAGVEVVHV